MAAAAASLFCASPRAASPANSWPFIKKSDPASIHYVNAGRSASASSASAASLGSRWGGRKESKILAVAVAAAASSSSAGSRAWTEAAEEAASTAGIAEDDDVMAEVVAVVDLYEVLGVESSAKQQEIRRSYRWLQKKCHPDIAGPALGHSMAILLNHAYKTLSDPDQRAAYDQSRRIEDGAADLDGYTGMPLYSTWVGSCARSSGDIDEQQAVFVDENRCVGCLKCALIAPHTFAIETRFGRARAVAQCADPYSLVEDAIHSCPVDCISWVDRSVLPVFEFAMSKIPRVPVGLEVHSSGGVRSVDVFTEAERLIQKLRRRKDLERSSTSVKETLAQRGARVAAMNEIQARAGRWWYDYLGAVGKSSSGKGEQRATSASSFQRKAHAGAMVPSSFFHARSAATIGQANLRYIMEASRIFAESNDYNTSSWSNHEVKYKHPSTEDCEYWVQGPVPVMTDINHSAAGAAAVRMQGSAGMALDEISCDNQRRNGSSNLNSCNIISYSSAPEKNMIRSGTGNVKMRPIRDRLSAGRSSIITEEDLMMWRSLPALWMSGAAASYVATTDEAQKLLLPTLFNIADNITTISRASTTSNSDINADMIIGVGPIPCEWMQSMEMHVVLTAIVWYLVGAALGSLLGTALMFAQHDQHASDES